MNKCYCGQDRANCVSPCDGGCWFCHKKTDDMNYDSEFDTFYHRDCLDIAVEQGNPEADIMANYLG